MLPEEKAEALREMLEGDTWIEVVRPAFSRRVYALQQNCMTMVPPDPCMVSRLQGEYNLLRKLLENPEWVLLDEEATSELPVEKSRSGPGGNHRRYGTRG